MKIVILGDPVPQKRHRHVNQGGFVRTYDPSAKDKQNIASIFGQHKPHNCPCCVKFTFELPIPISTSKSLANAKLWGFLKPGRPDLDNLAKFYLDCMIGHIFLDDSQVVYSSQKKVYSLQPKTIIEIYKLPEVRVNEQSQEIFKLISPKQTEDLCNLALEISECHERVQKTQIQPEYEPEKIEEAADAYYLV